MKKLMLSKLEEQLNALKLTADHLPIPVIVHHVPDFSIVYMNKVGLDILGVDLAELQTIDPKEYVTRYFNIEDDAESSAKIHDRVTDVSSQPASFFSR